MELIYDYRNPRLDLYGSNRVSTFSVATVSARQLLVNLPYGQRITAIPGTSKSKIVILALITIKQLHELEGSVWAENISSHINNAHVLLWHTASELASFIELFLPVEQVSEVAPQAVWAMEGVAEYFADLDVPRPLTVEALLLRLARHKAGLEPDGE